MSEEINRQKALRLDEIDAHSLTLQTLNESRTLNGKIASELDILVDVGEGKFTFDGELILLVIKTMKEELERSGGETLEELLSNINKNT